MNDKLWYTLQELSIFNIGVTDLILWKF